MGWYNAHLYQFEIGEDMYSNPAFQLEDSRSDRTITPTRLIPGEKFKFHYAYDMGDYWEHVILVERVVLASLTILVALHLGAFARWIYSSWNPT